MSVSGGGRAARYRRFVDAAPAPRRNLLGQVVEDLGLRIVRGEHGPGDTLPTEAELVDALGVSRSVVREAIKSLAAKGLVASRSRAGIRVLPRSRWNALDLDLLAWRHACVPRSQFVHELYDLRWAVEPSVAELAARRATPAGVACIRAAHEAMCAAYDADSALEADLEFHLAVVEACGNDLLMQVESVIGVGLLVSFREWQTSYESTVPLHGELADAIGAADGERAFAVSRALLRRSLHFIELEFGPRPDVPAWPAAQPGSEAR